jgi:DNA-directed RNA polymerase subunit RPC12/RpoP
METDKSCIHTKNIEPTVTYICIKCGNDNFIKEYSTKESLKCISCNYRILMKSRDTSRPLIYKAR